ncbi:hypothetical protein FRB98_004435 [Tulasnella sp. 332]|nr:hypothetical protein FRB98_004435 [Tulasnella sp. 332]
MGDIKSSKDDLPEKQLLDGRFTSISPANPKGSSPISVLTRHICIHPFLCALLASYALVFYGIPRIHQWTTLLVTSESTGATVPKFKEDTAFGWKDNIYPIREHAPWDISTDFPSVRKLVYDVEEGTWLRVDVSPDGDIVFDMLGDIYCIPWDVIPSSATSTVRAYPILQGVPYDSDPHISPDGTQLAFRSDAGLGISNIWIKPWSGCRAASEPVHGDDLWLLPNPNADPESEESNKKNHRRLVREGRADAFKITNETFRWVSDARWHPDGDKLIATKWHTSERTIPAGEGWLYDIPSPYISPGDGVRLVGRSLPLGWTSEQYGDQQIGPEQFIWWGDDRLIYSKNVIDTNGQYEYSKDVYKGINAIFSYNVTSGVTETLVDANPGGASRPEISHDGRTLAFVRRVRDKEALVLKDLESGTIRNIWYGLTYDLSVISAPMGTYPSFSFTPTDDAIIVWAAGSLWTVPLSVDDAGERTRGGEPWKIKWKATIEKRMATTRLSQAPVAEEEEKPRQRIRAFTELSVDAKGERVTFRAGAKTYWQALDHSATPAIVDPLSNEDNENVNEAAQLPVLYANATYYSPSFIPNEPNLLIHTRWSDTFFSTFEIADILRDAAFEVEGLPLGRYDKPTICECVGLNRRIAFVRKGGDAMTGNIVAIADPGLYVGSLTLPSPFGWGQRGKVRVRDVKRVSKDIPSGKMRFTEGASKLIIHDASTASVINLSTSPNDLGEYPTTTIAKGKMSTEISVTPPRESDSLHGPNTRLAAAATVGHVAFVDFLQVYLADGVEASEGNALWSKPGPNATHGLARVSVDGGHDLSWSADGKRLFWLLGPYLHSLEVSRLGECKRAIRHDSNSFGIDCVKTLLNVQEIYVAFEHERSRIKKAASDAFVAEHTCNDQKTHDRHLTSDILIIRNATVVSMITGNERNDILHRRTLEIRDGVIVESYAMYDNNGVLNISPTAPGAKIIDAEGAMVVPGFVDVHAHWNGQDTVASSWEQRTFLAYGCTTVHNPSIDTVTTWTERARVESGSMIGPRIFHTGTIIYGGAGGEYHQDIADMAEARSALIRLKVEGGPYSFSYKNYQLPARASRQRLIKVAKELEMRVYPEGGMNFDWDMTYILDGMTTVEHSLPIPIVYQDVMTLFAESGTGNTPTHIVNYGGVFGETHVWAHTAVPFNQKQVLLREFVPHALLETISSSLAVPKDAYQLFNTSASVHQMTKMGIFANIGAHGEPPLGLNYHKEMWFFAQGGMTPYEVLRSATRHGATSLGLFRSLGSLEPGKLADMVIYPAGVNILKDINLTPQIRYVIKGGRVWDAETMIEEWPEKGKAQSLPPLNAD